MFEKERADIEAKIVEDVAASLARKKTFGGNEKTCQRDLGSC